MHASEAIATVNSRSRLSRMCAVVVRAHPLFSPRSSPNARTPYRPTDALTDQPQQVRGLIVQIGFHEHARASVAENKSLAVPAWHRDHLMRFSIIFFTVVGVAIAIMKDVPDVAGDAEAGVRTLAVRCGGR